MDSKISFEEYMKYARKIYELVCISEDANNEFYARMDLVKECIFSNASEFEQDLCAGAITLNTEVAKMYLVNNIEGITVDNVKEHFALVSQINNANQEMALGVYALLFMDLEEYENMNYLLN